MGIATGVLVAWFGSDASIKIGTVFFWLPSGSLNFKIFLSSVAPGTSFLSLYVIDSPSPRSSSFADSVTISTTLIPGASYQYFIDGAPISGVLAGVNSFTTDNFSVYDTDLHFEVGVNVITAGGCTGIATTTINLNYVTADPIQLSNGSISQNICAGTNPNLDLQSVGGEQAPDGVDDFNDGADYPDGAAITYQWQKRVNGGTWEDIIGATTRNISSTILLETTFFRRKSTTAIIKQVKDTRKDRQKNKKMSLEIF